MDWLRNRHRVTSDKAHHINIMAAERRLVIRIERRRGRGGSAKAVDTDKMCMFVSCCVSPANRGYKCSCWTFISFMLPKGDQSELFVAIFMSPTCRPLAPYSLQNNHQRTTIIAPFYCFKWTGLCVTARGHITTPGSYWTRVLLAFPWNYHHRSTAKLCWGAFGKFSTFRRLRRTLLIAINSGDLPANKCPMELPKTFAVAFVFVVVFFLVLNGSPIANFSGRTINLLCNSDFFLGTQSFTIALTSPWIIDRQRLFSFRDRISAVYNSRAFSKVGEWNANLQSE